MKRFLKVAFLVAVFIMIWPANLRAQGLDEFESNRDENGNIIRGSYMTNGLFDNIQFVGMGGVQTLISAWNFKTARITPVYDIMVTKWFTPTVGVRGGIQGISLEENYTPYNPNHYQVKTNEDRTICYYGQTYFHGDALIDLTTAIDGYDRYRRVNLIPYAHFGYLRLTHPDYGLFTNVYRDREIEAGVGVITSFYVTKHLSVLTDYRAGFLTGRFHDGSNGGQVINHSFAIGLAYTINKGYWRRSQAVMASREQALEVKAQAEEKLEQTTTDLKQVEESNTQLEEKVKELEVQIARKQDELAQLRAVKYVDRDHEHFEKMAQANPGDQLLARLAKCDFVVFFLKSKARLPETELTRLDVYIKDILSKDPKHIFYITGSADKGTGTNNTNIKLSRSRAAYIKDILMREYKIPAGQIVTKATLVTDKHEDARLDRCVLFENE